MRSSGRGSQEAAQRTSMQPTLHLQAARGTGRKSATQNQQVHDEEHGHAHRPATCGTLPVYLLPYKDIDKPAREVAKGNREGRSKEAARRAKGQRIERARRPDRPERPEGRTGTRGPEGKTQTTKHAPALQQQACPTKRPEMQQHKHPGSDSAH